MLAKAWAKPYNVCYLGTQRMIEAIDVNRILSQFSGHDCQMSEKPLHRRINGKGPQEWEQGVERG